MIPTVARNLRHRAGGFLVAAPGGFRLVEDPLRAGRWTQANAEALLPFLGRFGINSGHLDIVPAPACGCCGAYRPADLRESFDQSWAAALRCERHHLRLPCIITGCGRTFRLELCDSWESRVVCGRHWRLAPRYMRDRVARLRKLASRRGWPDRLRRLHGLAFEAVVRAIERTGGVGGEGHIDIAEIERMFGV